MMNSLKKKKILLIVTGGIACYKTLDLIRKLQEKEVVIECIITNSAKKFINTITFESLLGKKIHSNLFSLTSEKKMSHIRLADEMDAIIVIPCTANFIAKMAAGIADDLASNILLASQKIKIIAPAMNSNMWSNSAVRRNLRTLTKMKVEILPPKTGRLACGTQGEGKLMDIENIVENLGQIFHPKELSGIRAIVTAGPSIEKIDAVRFLSNFSSGIQGYEIAKSLSNLGAKTILITGQTNIEKPKNIKILDVESGADFYKNIVSNLPCEVFVSVAAISDWKSKRIAKNKIKKTKEDSFRLDMIKNIDVLNRISNHTKRPQLIIGFSAETGNLIINSKKKLKKKGCDWIIANQVTEGKVFRSTHNKVSFITKDSIENWPRMKKSYVAKKISKKIVNFLKKK